MSDEPTRPSNVPTDAVWNAGENEWELGEKNAAGNHVGEWPLLDEAVSKHIDLSVDAFLQKTCGEGSVWQYVDRRSFMRHALSGKPVFASRR